MFGRHVRRTLALAVFFVLGSGVVAAFAQAPVPRNRVTLSMIAKNKIKINRYFQAGLRFGKDVVVVKAGGTLVVRNQTRDEPHSLSFVPKSALPKTLKAINGCFQGKGICGPLGQAHQIDQQGNPKVPAVDINQPGIDTASPQGDSWIFAPRGQATATLPSTRTLKVTARAGTTLWFICGFHPWMQGVLRVR